ncbi:hypothetical protein IQ61_16935 [Streptomyces scabiei]|nr:hypothetical protein IQ61_16935 [Streptomyces scabiei]
MHLPSLIRRQAIVVPAAMVFAVTAMATTAHSAPIEWQVEGNIRFTIEDHEDWVDNEWCNYSWEFTHDGRRGGPPQDHFWFAKCGGEIRAELRYHMFHLSNPGQVIIDRGSVKLFEGTSEDTADEDGGYLIGFPDPAIVIPDGKTVTKTFTVTNAAEDEPEDKAVITVSWKALPIRLIGHPPH